MTTRANCTRSENVRPSANVFASSTNAPPARSPLHSLYRNLSATERRIGRAGSGVAISERTGTAAVGDSGKASMSVASTGLGEREGLPGLDSAGFGGGGGIVRLAPRVQSVLARARSTVRISDADPLVHLQTFAAFIKCCSQYLPFQLT